MSPANIRWGDVSDKIRGELNAVRERLESAPIADVPRLQGEAAALRNVIAWFEHGAIAERTILSISTPHEPQD